MQNKIDIKITPEFTKKELDRFTKIINGIFKANASSVSVSRMKGEYSPFIEFLASIDKWEILKNAAAIFLAQVAIRAAGKAWTKRQKIAEALKDTSVIAFGKFIAAINDLRNGIAYNPSIIIGLPIPNPNMGTAIHIRSQDEKDIAWFVACFIAKADKIEEAAKRIINSENKPLGRIQLILQDDESFTMRWVDKTELIEHALRIE